MTVRRAMIAAAVLGLAIAGYLSYEHATAGTAFCPTGGTGCSKVQNSPELEIAGIYIPYIAAGGYAGILASLLVRRRAAMLWTAVLAYVGVGMTGYVTYLQAFVIEAWCPWCVISTALMWAIAVMATLRYVNDVPHLGRGGGVAAPG